MPEPAVKGTIYKGVVEDLRRLRRQGRVSNEQIEARLGSEDLAPFESEISPSSWYPMSSYSSIMSLLGDVEGEGKDAYFTERGRGTARRLMAAGLYQQLAFLQRWQESVDAAATDKAMINAYISKLKLITTLSGSIYNVGRWTVERDPDNARRAWTVVLEASDYTEPMRLAAEGFFNECAHAAREELTRLYISERLSAERIVFRMTRDIRDLYNL